MTESNNFNANAAKQVLSEMEQSNSEKYAKLSQVLNTCQEQQGKIKMTHELNKDYNGRLPKKLKSSQTTVYKHLKRIILN